MSAALLYLLIGLQILDLASTLIVLRRGVGTEANPVLAKLFAITGPVLGLLLVKVPVIVAVLIYPLPDIVLAGLDAFYLWVLANNIKVIRG